MDELPARFEEEHLGLYRMGFRTTQCPHTHEISVEFGADDNWLLLGTLKPFECDDGASGYVIETDYCSSSPYTVGNGVDGPAQHRLVFALRHLIGGCDAEIAEHMNAISFETSEE